MKITALHTNRLAAEMAREISGFEVNALHKSESEKKIIIQLSKESLSWSLYFHFAGVPSYLYLVEGFDRKISTTNFLPQLLGAEIKSVKQIGFDRIVQMVLQNEDDNYLLIIELFGHSSNLYLTDDKDRIITTIRKSSNDQKKYTPPETPDLLNPLEVDAAEISMDIDLQEDTAQKIAGLYFGIDPDIVEAAIEQFEDRKDSETDFDSNLTVFLFYLKNFCRSLIDPDTALYMDFDEDRIYLDPDEHRQRYEKLYKLLHDLSQRAPAPVKKKSAVSDYKAKLKRAIKREQKKVEKIQDALQKAGDYQELQREAELLSINLHKIEGDRDSLRVEDIYSEDNETITISLDPSISPGKNVEKKFERAKKLKENIPLLKRQVKQAQDHLNKLREIKSELDSLKDDKISDDLKSGLEELGIGAGPSKGKKGASKQERLPYRKYQSSLGEDILVGKSARDNDQLTFKHARKNDLWLHSQQTAGSHVILRRPNRTHQFQKRSIIEAAEIAAFFSAAKNADTVPVIYTEVKYVRKTRKGPPGQVIADRTRSILVTPNRPKN